MNKTGIRELKSKHRLELLIQDTGERFEANGDEWRSLDTPGLTVDIRRQTWSIESGGVETDGGDHFEWLKFRYGWNFGMCLRYLANRPADQVRMKYLPMETPSAEKMPQSVNACISEPQDGLQEKAIEVIGDSVRQFFSFSSAEIKELIFPVRFVPVIDFFADECSDCGREFDWDLPGMRCYRQEIEAEIRGDLDEYFCEECAVKASRVALALNYCFHSAFLREVRAAVE